MYKALLVAICLLLSFSSFSFECTAINRYAVNGEYFQSKVLLQTTLDTVAFLKMETKHRGQLYFVTYNKQDEDALLQIVDANNDTKGIVARTAFNKNGRMSLTLVDGQTVHRMECVN